jgi:hypothetical protein
LSIVFTCARDHRRYGRCDGAGRGRPALAGEDARPPIALRVIDHIEILLPRCAGEKVRRSRG